MDSYHITPGPSPLSQYIPSLSGGPDFKGLRGLKGNVSHHHTSGILRDRAVRFIEGDVAHHHGTLPMCCTSCTK